MELKKTPKADLQNKRGLFLEIGLVISLLLVIGAFLYTPKEHRIEQLEQEVTVVEEEMIEVTRQDQKPPEAPKKTEMKVIADMLSIVKNDTKITTDVDFSEFDEDTEIVQVVEVKEEEIKDDEPFISAETMPKFQGGDLTTFRNWVQGKVRYPGRVVLQFVIERDGRLTNIVVLQTPDRSLSEEAIRVLNQSPKWSPGKQRSQTVRVKYTLPVDFRIQN